MLKYNILKNISIQVNTLLYLLCLPNLFWAFQNNDNVFIAVMIFANIDGY